MNNSKTESPKITKIILRSLLTIHLIVIAAYTAFILVKHHEIFKLTITFVMLIVYGFMGVWVLLINSILMCCRQQQKAVLFNRIYLKFIVFLFPIFALLSISKDAQLNLPEVHLFIVYMAIITALLLIYELVTCIFYEQKHPDFLFEQNDLSQANAAVLAKRQEYNQFISQ